MTPQAFDDMLLYAAVIACALTVVNGLRTILTGKPSPFFSVMSLGVAIACWFLRQSSPLVWAGVVLAFAGFALDIASRGSKVKVQ